MLLVGSQQVFAQSLHQAESSTEKPDISTVEIIQLRTGLSVKINIRGDVALQLTNHQGTYVYEETVPANMRTYTMSTVDLSEGLYTLVVYTQVGIFEFEIKIE